jgi:hypothetical protein
MKFNDDDDMIQAESRDGLGQISSSTLHWILQAVVWTLGSMYKVSRRPLWMRQHCLKGKHCCYGKINSVHKLSDCTT